MKRTILPPALAMLLLLSLCPAMGAPALGRAATSGAVSGAGPSGAQEPRERVSRRRDRKFLALVARDQAAEIRLCRFAARRAQSSDVRAFARLMVNDHAKIEIRALGMAHAQRVRAHARRRSHEPGAARGHGRARRDAQARMMARLGRKRGAVFDRAFMAAQIAVHIRDIEIFADAAKKTDEDRLRRFAADTVDALRQTLSLARAVAAHVR